MAAYEDDDVVETLCDIVELGFVSIRDGLITQLVKPIENLYVTQWNRWDPTIKYLTDYARHHPDFGGEFFLAAFDGWREYSEPVAPEDRRKVQWLDLSPAERNKFIGIGHAGEPRFRASSDAEDAPSSVYPEMCRPVLAYNRHFNDQNVLLLPDSEFLELDFGRFRSDVAAYDRPFTQKIGRIHWRGSPNVTPGYRYCTPKGLGTDSAHQRNIAVALSQFPGLRGVLDASFAHAHLPEMLRYKYQLNLDGMVSAWSGTYWKLLSDSVVINAPSHWEHWYSRDLIADEHYIQMPSMEPQAFLDTYEWCERNPAKCQAIAAAGTALAKRVVNYEYAVSEYKIH